MSDTATATTITDLLDELAGAMDGARQKQQELDQFLATFEPAVALAEYNENIKRLRNCVNELLRQGGLKTVSTQLARATLVTRHDYQIEDSAAFVEQATKDGNVDTWRVWDLAAIKKFASKFRKDTGENYPGVVDVPKSFIEVTRL